MNLTVIKKIAIFLIVITVISFIPQPTLAKYSRTITFVNNRPTPFNWSESFVIPSGYKSMTWHVSSSDYIINWAPQVSYDGGLTWLEQHRFSCNSGSCNEVTIPIISNLYRFSLGTSNGIINATVFLNTEKSSKVILFSEKAVYPFISESFKTNSYNYITITAGGGTNPQHLTGISLQRLENGLYIEKERLTCDGGAECPLQNLPLFDGKYRIVLEGSGNDSVLAAILRR